MAAARPCPTPAQQTTRAASQTRRRPARAAAEAVHAEAVQLARAELRNQGNAQMCGDPHAITDAAAHEVHTEVSAAVACSWPVQPAAAACRAGP